MAPALLTDEVEVITFVDANNVRGHCHANRALDDFCNTVWRWWLCQSAHAVWLAIDHGPLASYATEFLAASESWCCCCFGWKATPRRQQRYLAPIKHKSCQPSRQETF